MEEKFVHRGEGAGGSDIVGLLRELVDGERVAHDLDVMTRVLSANHHPDVVVDLLRTYLRGRIDVARQLAVNLKPNCSC